MPDSHEAIQIIESGHRLASASALETRIAVEAHHLAALATGEAADRVKALACILKMIAAERRAELEQAQGEEGGPH